MFAGDQRKDVKLMYIEAAPESIKACNDLEIDHETSQPCTHASNVIDENRSAGRGWNCNMFDRGGAANGPLAIRVESFLPSLQHP